ncbi:MAG TPA: hypothetical protein VKZ53_10615 [Candidatus Angelobacter sp.]|nr:hypothetical protein [Candidatus Angelobacter sp.]
MTKVGDRVLHAHSALADEQNYQSDRSYPPFFSAFHSQEIWFSGATGVERVSEQIVFPSADLMSQVTLSDGRFLFAVQNDKPVLQGASDRRTRYLNPWAVIFDWSKADADDPKSLRVAGSEVYRDYPRTVLERKTPNGVQKLFLDTKTGFPVKLDFEEPNPLWGQRHVEYVYSTWVQHEDAQISSAAFRLADGDIELSQTTGPVDLLPASQASALLQMPPAPSAPPAGNAGLLQALTPSPVKVGATYVLAQRFYNEAVTLAGDEIYLFDSTQNEERAKLDHEQIRNLFPGQHKINVVVTDFAWPHVGGVRYWVAQGATIIAHKAEKPVLQNIVDRRWTLKPDELEQHRASAKFKFVGLDSPQQFAGGAITMIPIDGIGSEVALAAFVAADRFLWASDYIQDTSAPAAYTTDVWNAVQRAGFKPERFAAEHVALNQWEVIEKLQSGNKQ